jgi:hypothetical protein
MYANDNKLKVNNRRLTKKLVKEEILRGSKFREDLSELFSNTTSIGYIEKPKVYELDTGNFLYVFDENDISIAGKGDIYNPEIFQRIIKKYKRHLTDRDKPIGSSVTMWRFFSKIGNDVINKVENLRFELANKLHLNEQNLDFTYKSLDNINEKLVSFEIEEIRENFYDHLLAYIGEVIRRRIGGEWQLNEKFAGDNYPYIDIGIEKCQLMPLNVLAEEFTKIMELDLRKATANEIRANSYYTSMKKKKNER